MTLIEEAVADATADVDASNGITVLSGFLASYRERVLAWLDEHANDTVVRILLWRVRVRDIRWVVEQLID